MKRPLLWAVGMLILSLTAVGFCAEEQDKDKGKTSQQNAPAAPGMSNQEPNQQQFEQLREQTRQRIRDRMTQRRRQAAQDRMEPGQPMDVNLLTKKTDRRKTRDDLAQKPTGQGDQRQQQLGTIEEQMSQEEAKHLERVARLERIRELAQQGGDTEAIARVDTLLKQEQRRYGAKTMRMQHRRDRVVEFKDKAESDKNKRTNVIDANKNSNKPRSENQ